MTAGVILLAGCAGSSTRAGDTAPVDATTTTAGATDNLSYLFVISGESGRIDGVGADTGDEIADAAPNAVLSYTEPEDPMPHSIVVELTNPVYDEAARTLAFTAQHLHRQTDAAPDATERTPLPHRTAPARRGPPPHPSHR